MLDLRFEIARLAIQKFNVFLKAFQFVAVGAPAIQTADAHQCHNRRDQNEADDAQDQPISGEVVHGRPMAGILTE